MGVFVHWDHLVGVGAGSADGQTFRHFFDRALFAVQPPAFTALVGGEGALEVEGRAIVEFDPAVDGPTAAIGAPRGVEAIAEQPFWLGVAEGAVERFLIS